MKRAKPSVREMCVGPARPPPAGSSNLATSPLFGVRQWDPCQNSSASEPQFQTTRAPSTIDRDVPSSSLRRDHMKPACAPACEAGTGNE